MEKRSNFFSIFLVFLCLSLLIWGLSSLGVLNEVRAVLEKITSPFERTKYSFLQKIPSFFADPRIIKLTQENITLRSKIIDQRRLEQENSALLDQFKTTTPTSYNLLPAQIIGNPASALTLDKGTKDGVKVGLSVVYKDNLVGKVTKVSSYLSKVDLINNPSSSFAAKTENRALGIVTGNLDKMILDKVVLSQNISVSDTVLTYGDLNTEGIGYPANLIVGKITSVDKNPSSLFQKAEVKSLLQFSQLTTVFIIMQR